jgi:hypothetical protein
MTHVLGILLCVLPVLSLGALLGGIDPPLVAGAMLVTLGAAVSGCAAALTLSTWGTKTHEVLLATYAAWALWLLSLPIWWGCRLHRTLPTSGFMKRTAGTCSESCRRSSQ